MKQFKVTYSFFVFYSTPSNVLLHIAQAEFCFFVRADIWLSTCVCVLIHEVKGVVVKGVPLTSTVS